MVVDRFPMFRFATLMARQLSAPIAVRIKVKTYAVSHPRFGTAVCVRLANVFHRCEWHARAWALRLAGVTLPATARPPPLPVRTAVNLGGDLLGEIIIFSLGSLIIIFEVNRQANKQEDKELNLKSQWLAIALSLEELQREVAVQQSDIERLHSALLELQLSHDHNDSPLDSDSEKNPDEYTVLSPKPTSHLNQSAETYNIKL